jgi:hypothetical protein
MRLIAYTLLGLLAGGLIGGAAGLYGTMLYTKLRNESNREGMRSWAIVMGGLYWMIAGTIFGALLGLWQGW